MNFEKSFEKSFDDAFDSSFNKSLEKVAKNHFRLGVIALVVIGLSVASFLGVIVYGIYAFSH